MPFKVDASLSTEADRTGTANASTPNQVPDSEATVVTSYSHDTTPLRQRELETLGNNLRSKVEGYSPGNSEFGHSHNSNKSGNSGPSGSEGGLGIKISSEIMGLETGARVGVNTSNDGGRSLSFRADHEVSPNLRNAPDGFQPNRSNNGVNDGFRSPDSRVSDNIRPEFRNTPPESFQSNRSNDGPRIVNDARDSVRSPDFRAGDNVRPEFRNAPENFQSNRSNDGPRIVNDARDGVRSPDFRAGDNVRTEFRNAPENFQPNRSNDGPGNVNNARDGVRSPDSRLNENVRPDFRNALESFRSHRSNDNPGGTNNVLRETIRTVRDELNALRPDFRGRSDHRSIGLNENQIERFLQIATRGLEDRLGRGEHAERIARQVRADLYGVIRLEEHFSQLERIGGEPVRRAYESVLNFVLSNRDPESNRLPWIAEVLRDLRTGAFLHPRDMEGPFPLTGRARIVSEMMALMRTLDAIERFAAETRANSYGKLNADLSLSLSGRMPGIVSVEVAEAVAKALANLGPTLPGMAGRIEVLRMIAALNGILTDSAGRPLITADGVSLKLGELLWFNGRTDAIFDLLSADRFSSSRFFPTLLHGFDAVYSLIGFDGRSLSLPHFIAIQSQMNASEFEWFFGQAPFSEGWLRSVIEFLKDSISFDQNVLGETLEEALTNSRFHVAVMRGTVEDGRPVAGSFSFACP